MTYWICITNRENWEVIKRHNVWGVPKKHKNTLSRVKPGDKLVIYVRQEKDKEGNLLEPKIVGIYEVTSEPYVDFSRIFKPHRGGKETYPYRVKIKPIKIGEINFKPLINDLKFIKNKKRWSMHFLGRP